MALAKPKCSIKGPEERLLDGVAAHFRCIFPPGIAARPHLHGPPTPRLSLELGGAEAHLWVTIMGRNRPLAEALAGRNPRTPRTRTEEFLRIEYFARPKAFPDDGATPSRVRKVRDFPLDVLIKTPHDLIGWLSVVRRDLDQRVYRDLTEGEIVSLAHIDLVKLSEPFESRVVLAPAPGLRRQLRGKGPIRLTLAPHAPHALPRWTWRTLDKVLEGFHTVEETLSAVPELLSL